MLPTKSWFAAIAASRSPNSSKFTSKLSKLFDIVSKLELTASDTFVATSLNWSVKAPGSMSIPPKSAVISSSPPNISSLNSISTASVAASATSISAPTSPPIGTPIKLIMAPLMFVIPPLIFNTPVPLTDVIALPLIVVINPLTLVWDNIPPKEVETWPVNEADVPLAENVWLAFKLILEALTLNESAALNEMFLLDSKLILPSTMTFILPLTYKL